jgi:hypothetical protein
MADNKEQLDDNLIKALKNVLSDSEFDEFMKANKPEEKETKDEEKEDESEEEVIEKAFKKAKEDYKAMKMACKSKKAELEKAFPDKFNDEDEDEEIGKEEKEKETKKPKEVEKSIQPDLVKAFSEALDIKFKDLSKANTDLLNSFESLKDENTELKKAIEVIGSQRTGMKSVTKSSFIEKANQNGFGEEEGKTVLSISQHKALVENALGDAMEKAEAGDIKKAIGDCLMNFNSGNAPISQEIATYLYKTNNIKLVQ